MLSAEQIADKWSRNTSGAGQAYEEGIMSVNESPTAKAADAQDRYVAGVQRAADSGKFRDGLLRVSLQEWKTAAINKGKGRLASGVTSAKPKMASFLRDFLPFVQSVKESLPARGTFEDNLNRMNENARRLHEFRRRS